MAQKPEYIGVRLTEAEREALEDLVWETGQSLSQVVRDAIRMAADVGLRADGGKQAIDKPAQT